MLPTHQDLSTQVRAYVALGLVVVMAVVGANAATASFTDVPPENQFAESVTRVQESGIATGFPDGSFRPKDPINRQQAAAWIDRSASRVGFDLLAGADDSPELSAANPSAVVSELSMTSPAAEGGRGYVTIQGGAAGVSLDETDGCPCVLQIIVRDEEGNLAGRSVLTVHSDPDGFAYTVVPIVAVVPIDGGESHTYRLIAQLTDTEDDVRVGGAIYAEYSPIVDGDPSGIPEPESTPSSASSDPVESMTP